MFLISDSGGQPLVARQNPLIYLIVVYLAIFIFILLAIMLILKIVKKHHQNPQYLEHQKNILTTYKHVQNVSKILNLSKEQMQLLWKICRDTKAKNILYSYTDDSYIESIFKKEFLHLKKANASDKMLYKFFNLRFLIYKTVTFSKEITSSYKIPNGTILTYSGPSFIQYNFTVIKNDNHGLFLSVPENMDQACKDRPERLAKLPLIFTLSNGVQYAMVNRVVQFLEMPNGGWQLLVTHSNTVCPQSRRNSKRFTVNKGCTFSAVEIEKNNKGELSFKPKENFYKATIKDISEGGCNIHTNLPIKQKQYLYLRFIVLEKEFGVLGQIVDTRKDYITGFYSLHIAFKQMSLQEKVWLLTDLYGYNDSTTENS